MRVTAAVVREKEQPFSLEELELEEPRIDEVQVRVTGEESATRT
jgi:Zn-dependent alcohol dehydrogenase